MKYIKEIGKMIFQMVKGFTIQINLFIKENFWMVLNLDLELKNLLKQIVHIMVFFFLIIGSYLNGLF
jgi:hypothetical protein